MMLVEIQIALCILSLHGKRRGRTQVNKIFFPFYFSGFLISGCVLKYKLHKTEIPQITGYGFKQSFSLIYS